MKKLFTLILFGLLLPSLVLADPIRISATRNTATTIAPLCFRNSSTGVCAAPGTVTCVTEKWAEGASPTAFTTACANTPAAIGVRNEIALVTTAGEVNADYAGFIISSNTASTIPIIVSVDTLHSVLTTTTNLGKTDVQKIKGFSVENGVTQTNGSPSTTSFKMDASDTRVYQPGQAVTFAFASGAPDGESSIIQSCAASVCTISPAVSVAVPSGVTYFVGVPSVNLTAPGAALTSCPGATATGVQQLQFQYMMSHNKVTCTNSLCTLYANDGTTAICTWVPGDNGTTASVGQSQ